MLATKGAELSAKALAALLKMALRKLSEPKIGKQSMKELSKGGSLANIEITDQNIKAFEPIARKYNIGYALMKDASQNPPHWFVFFKARDVDSMTSAFKEFTSRAELREDERPSVREKMQSLQQSIANAARDITRHMRREGHER